MGWYPHSWNNHTGAYLGGINLPVPFAVNVCSPPSLEVGWKRWFCGDCLRIFGRYVLLDLGTAKTMVLPWESVISNGVWGVMYPSRLQFPILNNDSKTTGLLSWGWVGGAMLPIGFGEDEMNLLVTFNQFSRLCGSQQGRENSILCTSWWMSNQFCGGSPLFSHRRRRRSPGVRGKGMEADRKLTYHTCPYVHM